MLKGHGRPIYLYTDHKNIQLVLNPRLCSRAQHLERLHRRAVRVQDLNLVAVHVKGELNFMADFLSRAEFSDEVATLMTKAKQTDKKRSGRRGDGHVKR